MIESDNILKILINNWGGADLHRPLLWKEPLGNFSRSHGASVSCVALGAAGASTGTK